MPIGAYALPFALLPLHCTGKAILKHKIMPYCKQCSCSVDNGDRFCHHCGTSLTGGSNIEVRTGPNSENSVVGVFNQSPVQHVENQYTLGAQEAIPTITYANEHQTPLKNSWLVNGAYIGGIGFLGSLASIYGWLQDIMLVHRWTYMLPLIVTILSLMALYLGTFLQERAFPVGMHVLYLDNTGRICYAKAIGKCPKDDCDGDLGLRTYQEHDSKFKKWICSRRPERHQFTFCPSDLPHTRPESA